MTRLFRDNPALRASILRALPDDQMPVGEGELVDQLCLRESYDPDAVRQELSAMHGESEIRWVMGRGWAKGSRPS